MKHKRFKGVQQTNTVKNYFTIATKKNDSRNTELQPITLEVIPSTILTKQIQDASKWNNLKYSRSEREKRAREQNVVKSGEKQLLITNYLEIVNNIKKYINYNNIFNESLEDLQKNMPPWEETPAELMLKKNKHQHFIEIIV